SGEAQQTAFATGVPSDINAFHRSTGSSVCPCLARACRYRGPLPGWAGRFHPRLDAPPTRPLSPVIPNNVRTVRLTAAAGTNLARASSGDGSGLAAFLPPDSALQPEGLHRARGVARSGLRPLPKILDCSLP